jgi:uncharacterized protein (TIGR04255 family)
MSSFGGHIAKLPKAPLQEVIFELYWDMDYNELGVPLDPRFEIAQGVFAGLIEKDFPFRKRTVPEGFPVNIYPKTIHQFWKADKSWPVVQIGPGIIAVNDTDKNYHWDKSFFPLIKYSCEQLFKAYKNEIYFNKISIRYIDAVEINDKNPLDFINSNFKVEVKSSFEISGLLTGANISQVFRLADDSQLSIVISNGLKNNGSAAMIWQSQIQKEQTFTLDEVFDWTHSSHKVLSDLFKKVITPEFYGSFV